MRRRYCGGAARGWLLGAALTGGLAVALEAATILDFEDLAGGATITRQYAQRGVVFRSAYLAVDPAARSGTRVLRAVSPATEVFTPVALEMVFVRSQSRIRLFASSAGTPRNGTLKVFGQGGVAVGQDGPRMVAADRYSTLFEVSLPTPLIRRAELHLDGAAHFAIDDLEFDIAPGRAPLVRVVESKQPAARDHPAVAGRFPLGLIIGDPPAVDGLEASPPEDAVEDESFPMQFPPTVERELAPGATAELVTQVAAGTGVGASARWVGTTDPLRVALSLNGTTLGVGKAYRLGAARGGADVGGVATSAGEMRLTVTNTSKVRVTVRLDLAAFKGQLR